MLATINILMTNIPGLVRPQRDQLLRNKRNGDEKRCEHDPGRREDDLRFMRYKPLAEQTLGAKKQTEDPTQPERRRRGDRSRLKARPYPRSGISTRTTRRIARRPY